MSQKNQKKQILFSKSMNIDKRNENFAYLRKNVFDSDTPGLYPSQDFIQERPDSLSNTVYIEDILGSENSNFDIKVIVKDGDDVRFYNLGSNSEANTVKTNVDYECGAFGDDGVKICLDDDKLYTVNHQNGNISEEGTFTDARPDIAGFDGLYTWWLSNNEIYKATTGAPTVAFNNLGLTPRFVDFLNDQMVIFCEEAGSIIVLFWDKSDTDLFDKRIVIKNAKLVAGGVNDGVLQVVKSVGNSSNVKERNGEIVVSAYDGEKFVDQNSIKAGDEEIDFVKTTGVGVGSKVMLFSVDFNDEAHNQTLYQNYIYKISPSGKFEVQYLPDEATYGKCHIVRVFYNFICFALEGEGTQKATVWTNEATDEDYGDYEDYNTTEYVTNFLNNARNRHQLEAFGVVFEKLFEQTTEDPTGEQLDLYYRTSEREDFTQFGSITVEKVKDNINPRKDQSTEYDSDTIGLPEQVYIITKMPDLSALPEYNEIQFKFVPIRGFSIIDAWYEYSYLTKNEIE